MGMIQLVIGAACGFLLAQAALYGLRRLLGWARHADFTARVRAVRRPVAPAVVSALIRYAAPVGIGVALATLGVWAVSDYLAARSARNAEANLFDAGAGPETEQGAPRIQSASLTPPPPPEPVAEPVSAADPYADPQFRVQHKARRTGDALRETLVQQSEVRARGELLREVQQHARRSQYDCEAAARADRYLKAGLDVWGFATWQVKYFPTDGFRGATLEHCRDIKNIVASAIDLQSAVAQQNQDDSGQR